MEKFSFMNTRLILTTLLLGLLCFSFLGEKIPYNNGAGWDGVKYREVTLHFDELIQNKGIDKYHMNRILPFAMVHYGLKVINAEMNEDNALKGCCVFNLLCILISVAYFFKLSSFFKWSKTVEIIGFSACFFNVPILKIAGYSPFLTDYAAFLLSIMAFYYFFKRDYLKLCITGIIAVFAWPLLSAMVLVMAVFPKNEVKPYVSVDGLSLVFNYAIRLFFIFWIPLSFVVYFIFCSKAHPDWGINMIFPRVPINYLFVVFAGLFVVFFYYKATNVVNINWRDELKQLFAIKRFLIILTSFVVFFILYYLSQYLGGPATYSSLGQIKVMFRYPLSDIAIFIESHFVYLGVFFVLLIIYWKDIFHESMKYGIGLLSLLLLGCLFLSEIETRKLISFYPIGLVLLMNVLNDKQLKSWVPYVFVFVSLPLSFFWFPINVDGIEQAFIEATQKDIFTGYPEQRYFMFMGPWQSHTVAYVSLFVEIVFIIVIKTLIKKGLVTTND